MNVLGIETSCDETAAAVVKDGRRILSNIISSTLALHKRYGGVIPEIAARGHLEAINFVICRALKKAKLSFEKIGLIAVTSQPGLPGALLVGRAFSQALSFGLNVELIEVDHIRAHLYAPFLDHKDKRDIPRFPAVGLVVSGGHTSLFYCKDFNNLQVLGQTRDDACGEAFDKVAKILELPYPGGPYIDRLAAQVLRPDLRFTCARLPGTFDFSFSGIKTAILYFVRDWQKKHPGKKIPRRLKAEVASAFEHALVQVIIEKAIAACRQKRVSRLIVGGGVAANSMLRQCLSQQASDKGIRVNFATKSLCTDNAAMVAGLAYRMRT
jgi:N6-L-threonylcarbamoyladenine synthase